MTLATNLSLIAAAIALSAGAAAAADLPLPADLPVAPVVVAPQWEFAIAPYFWAAGMSGDVAQFGLPAIEVDASFSDIFKNLDFGAMMVSELRYDRFGLFSDFMYVKLSGEAGTPRGILADDVSLDTSTLAFTAAAEYRVIDELRGSFDVMAGARVWSVDTDLHFDGGLLDDVDASDGDTWVDPLIGAKGRFNITDKFYLTGWAMAGGFGAASDFMWDAMGAVGYQFNNTVSAVLGYRGMGVDYEHDGFEFDVVEQGPISGVVIRF